jgi:hypothetical protein
MSRKSMQTYAETLIRNDNVFKNIMLPSDIAIPISQEAMNAEQQCKYRVDVTNKDLAMLLSYGMHVL